MDISKNRTIQKKPTPRAFIFDLDGTLCDTLPDLMSAMNAMLRTMSYPQRSRKELLGFINRGNRYFVYKSLPDGVAADMNDPLVDRAMAINAAAYEKCFTENTAEYEGITPMLKELKRRGMRLAILTNKRDHFAKKLATALFDGIFDAVRGNIDKMPAKPDPSTALGVAADLGVNPEDCVFVGDSDVDMKTATNSGMYPLGVLWGYRDRECLTAAGAAAFAERPRDIVDLFFNEAVSDMFQDK